MVVLCDDLQRDFLDQLLAQHPEDVEFARDLEHIRRKVGGPAEETAAQKELRLQAEQRVKLVVQDRGEKITHGDLLSLWCENGSTREKLCETLL